MPGAAPTATARPTGPLDGHEFSRLAQAIQGLSGEQLAWASGYLAGLAAPPRQDSDDRRRLTIPYASQGGNARSVAEGLVEHAARSALVRPVVNPAEDYHDGSR